MSVSYDVIILGGGPAGSTAAALLAKRGRKVLVLEREVFPRFHIGESLLPYNREIFAELGLLERMEQEKFMPKHGAQFWLCNGKKSLCIKFREGSFNKHTSAFQVERAEFDHMLLRHAAASGAEVREATTVTGYAIEKSHVSVTFQPTHGGEIQTATASFLLDASGMANFTGNREGLKEAYQNHRKIAIFGHFTGLPMDTGDRYGDIVIVRLEDGWFWLIPLTDEKVSVGLVVDSAKFKASGLSPQEMFDQAVQSGEFLRGKMAQSQLLGKLHVISDFSYMNRRLTSPRLMRLGDAAGFMDPIFSSGVHLAMTSASAAASAVDEAIRSGKAFTRSMVRYEKELRRQMNQFWRMIEGFYTQPFIDLFFEPAPPLNMRSAVNSLLAGRLRLTWPIRWRLWVFFKLVQLHRRFGCICPRTDYS